MALYDITVTLRADLPVYPGDAAFEREVISRIADGGVSNLSVLRMSAHHGTHVDAPLHMIDGGSTVTDIPPEALVGPALVVDATGRRSVGMAALDGIEWKGVERVLFKTDNSGTLEHRAEFTPDFVYLEPEAAEFLAGLGLNLVGVDYLSADAPAADGFPAHIALLGAGIVLLEGVDLSGVPAGEYDLFCGPLKLKDADGAPARAFLKSL